MVQLVVLNHVLSLERFLTMAALHIGNAIKHGFRGKS